MRVKLRIQRVVIAAILGGICLLQSSCETTGDPNQGGFFGWSETKARDRQIALERRIDASDRTIAREQYEHASLQGERESLERAVGRHRDSLDALRKEVRSLDAEIKSTGEDSELLREKIAKVDRKIAALQTQLTNLLVGNTGDYNSARSEEQRLEQEIVELQHELQLLVRSR